MAAVDEPTGLTVELSDRELYQVIRRVAAERGQPLSEIIDDALREWLEREEEREDLEAIAGVEDEPTVPWEQVKAEMRAARAVERAG